MQTTTQVTSDSIRDTFNEALNFALDELNDDHDAVTFLTMWREGRWDELARDFPEWLSRPRKIPA